MSSLYGVPLSREELRRRTGRVEQLLGAELVERADGSERGVRCVRLRSGAIELEVVVDRALDLAQATIGGVPVAWISPTGLTAPGLAVPAGWEPFRSFVGGLLTTCGLEHTLGRFTQAALDLRQVRVGDAGHVGELPHRDLAELALSADRLADGGSPGHASTVPRAIRETRSPDPAAVLAE